MKVLNYAFAAICIGLLCIGNALAQSGHITAPVERTSFAYDSYYAADEDAVASPSDAPVAGAPAADAPAVSSAGCGCAAAASCGCDSGCDSGCGTCCERVHCCPAWKLQNCENCWGITYGGWLSGGITANSHGNTTSNGNAQVAFNNDPNPQINQAWFYLNKDADTESYGWDWGFRVDVMAGSDGPDTQAFGQISGYDNDWDWGGPANQYGAALPQAYVTLANNDLSVKIGHFYTIIGYEVVQATGNFFYSHAYMQNYGEPFTHTGVLADYQLNDQVKLTAGWTTGWDQGFHNPGDASTFLGGISLTSLDENTSLTYAVNVGDWGDGRALTQGAVNNGDIFMQSIVLSHKYGDDWTYVIQSDLGINNQLPPGAVPANAALTQTEWYGINQYLLKDINDFWGIGFRFEWFRDDDGVRVDRAGANTGTAADAANYYAATAGVNWKPNANLTIRPEVRYDWRGGTDAGARFDPVAGTYRKNDLVTFGVDGVLTF